MSEWWQHLPELIDPIAFTVGSFSVRWYSLCWLLGFFGALVIVKRLAIGKSVEKIDFPDLFFYLFFGAFLGGRFGYVLWYQPAIFLADPLRILSPFDATGAWGGLSGMSFHGGLLGVVVVLFFFARKHQAHFWDLADVVALAAPIALFFGRIGNFLNQELYGRPTAVPWGMFFPESPAAALLRHPSVLYEAFFEGAILFLVLCFARRSTSSSGGIAILFVMGYGLIRFILEFFREPDNGALFLFGWMTKGQLLSVSMMLLGALLFLWQRKKKPWYTIDTWLPGGVIFGNNKKHENVFFGIFTRRACEKKNSYHGCRGASTSSGFCFVTSAQELGQKHAGHSPKRP